MTSTYRKDNSVLEARQPLKKFPKNPKIPVI